MPLLSVIAMDRSLPDPAAKDLEYQFVRLGLADSLPTIKSNIRARVWKALDEGQLGRN